MTTAKAVLLVVNKKEMGHVHRFRGFFPGYTIKSTFTPMNMVTQVRLACRSIGATKVICTQYELFQKLVQVNNTEDAKSAGNASIDAYAGSMFTIPAQGVDPEIEVLIGPNPIFLSYDPKLRFLAHRWCQKLTNPNFPEFPPLDWETITAHNFSNFHTMCTQALMVAVDIETKKIQVKDSVTKNPAYNGLWVMGTLTKSGKKKVPLVPVITMVGYTALLQRADGSLYSKTGVLHINSMTDVEYMRALNLTPAPKVLQNGQYDCTYFLRYNAPMRNYLYDTYVAMHSWYCELKRDLSFITAFFDRKSMYWKDESERAMAQYNAKDTHNTLWSMVHLLNQWPQWAQDNYAENFRMVFPCITCGLDGFAVDQDERARMHSNGKQEVENTLRSLHKIITPGFNPNSPKQMLALLHGLGYKKATSSDAKTLQAFSEQHPLFEKIAGLITNAREHRKALSTYFESELIGGRLLYELNPAGTETGRLASKASNLWCGTQVQNQPLYAKSQYLADPGYELNAADNGQSESRCTAYISEDANLIRTVEAKADFHKTNATLFFGLSFDEITKPIRDTAKRVNHGANYNMGAHVLWQTMGTKAVLLAKKLLKLPSGYSIIDVCNYLLSCFDAAYPDIRGKYYQEVIREIQLTRKLRGATGWTRYCFGDPTNSKPELNSYVAHAPQSLSVKIINDAFFETWLRLQIQENVIRLKAQVHDEIIWQSRPEHTKYSTQVISELMSRPTIVRGRSMVIPNDPKTGARTWAELKD